MTAVSITQPDVTLFLDLEGVIQSVSLSDAMAAEGVDSWLGRPWVETVVEGGGERVRHMVEDARSSGVAAFREVKQRFPSGLELPMEYMAVRLGPSGGLMAIGRNLQAVAELQARLVEAQQAMERDYWKLREIETRYRLLFDASNEAVLLIRATSLRIVEANPAAMRALGMAPAGREFPAELAPADREPFQAMLAKVREQGKAPGILVHLGRDRQPWLIRASLMTAEPGPVFMLQLAPVGATRPAGAGSSPAEVESLIDRLPDGFVVIDRDGLILEANRAFLDLAQIGAKARAVGQRLGRWLGRPGADLTVLTSNVQRHGVVRLFTTTLMGSLGGETTVEISAAGNRDSEPTQLGVLLRNVEQRLPPAGNGPGRGNGDSLGDELGALARQIGRTPMRSLVRDTVDLVERHCIETALGLTGGNRTAAAELVGLSRQSLYAKLGRYGLDGGPDGETGNMDGDAGAAPDPTG